MLKNAMENGISAKELFLKGSQEKKFYTNAFIEYNEIMKKCLEFKD